MNRSPLRRAAVRLSYLSPLLFVALFTLLACLPQIFFTYSGEATRESNSLFSLMANGIEASKITLSGSEAVDAASRSFAYAVLIYCGLSIVCLILLWITALLWTGFSCYVFSKRPTSEEANKAKRWFRFFCPNRILLLLSELTLALPLCFPQVLSFFYLTFFGMPWKPHYLGVSPILVMGIFLLLSVALLFGTLPLQDAEHMDLYRLYRNRAEQNQKNN